MPTVGTRTDVTENTRHYESDPMHSLAEQFINLAQAALHENVSIFKDPDMFFQRKSMDDEMRKLFIKESYDPKDPRFQDAKAIQVLEHDMGELYKNDRQGIMESVGLSSFNPMLGITFPMHKNLLMNAVFDQSMPKDVAVSSKFTLTMETRTLVDTEGNEIDMFLEQYKIKDAIKNSVPTKDVIVTIPEVESVDIIKDEFGISSTSAALSTRTTITGVLIDSYVAVGESYYDTVTKTTKVVAAGDAGVKPVVFNIGKHKFVSSYGEFDRAINSKFIVDVKTDATTTKVVEGIIFGNVKKNKFILSVLKTTDVKALRINAVMDVSSAAFKTCKTKWSARTDMFDIPEAPHVTTTVSPEEVKDIGALYNVNQITKLMSQMKLALMHYKDDSIHEELDNSFLALDETQKISTAYDCIPPQGSYLASHIAWRQETFLPFLDKHVTRLLQVLNDENMTITVFGSPSNIRDIIPENYSYSSPSNIGPVELDFKKTVVTSDKRVYQFISSNKMRNNNNLIIILCPRNTQRVMYKIVDYQLYLSNEIRDTEQYQLPGITCFERWMFLEYQPIQGRIQLLNTMGFREEIDNPDPIGNNAANDFTSYNISHKSTINGAI